MPTKERIESLYSLWLNETNEDWTQEWREELTQEELGLVEQWDSDYCHGTLRICQAILSLEHSD